MFSALSSWILKLFGWKVTGHFPNNVPKYIIIVIPHTSNWDFPLGLLVRSAIGLRGVRYIAKSSLFVFPFGYIFRMLGGYPVDRSKRHNFVDAVVDVYNRKERFAVTMAPEGTRKKVDKLKTGFYYIALKANIPIIMCKFDWGTKVVDWREPFYPTGNIEADFSVIGDYFRDARGYNPEQGYLHNT